ncbi:MAG TPA: aspartyl protease family protein [Candidatus Baltobacteraceae bacterium]|nr:aspartyl protease family protein [Candidatus Baltobacteraceae bacterium]
MKFAARAALLCVLAASTGWAYAGWVDAQPAPPAAPALPPLSQLLTRMREINGGLWNAHMSSTSPHTVDGAPTILDTEAQGLRYVLSQCSGRVCLGTYFDGEHLFSVNINGTALPRSPDPEPYLRALRIIGTLDFLSPEFTQNGGRIEDGGWVTFDGRRCRRIYVSESNAVPMMVYVDPQNALVAGARDVDGDATYFMRDYRRVGEFMLPYDIERDGSTVERYITRTIVAEPLQIPRGLTPSIASMPAGMPLDPQSITPLGDCTIANVQVKCLIDSGNSAMSMSLELAEQLHLPPIGMMHIAGLGDYATEVVRTGPLQMGNVRFGEANYVVLSDIHRYGYDLVLGADVLANTPVTIDYTRHALYFAQQTAEDAQGTTVPLNFENFVPVIDVRLADVPAALAVDTGDQSNINLAYDYYMQHSSLFRPTKSLPVSGVGGHGDELVGEIPAVQIGTLTAENQQIGTTPLLKGTANGHLGAGFLSKYRITLDYAHKILRLLPKS